LRPPKNVVKTLKLDTVTLFTALFISGLLVSSIFPTEYALLWLAASILCFAASFKAKNKKALISLLAAAAILASMFYAAVKFTPSLATKDLQTLEGTKGEITGIFSGSIKKLKDGSCSFLLRESYYRTGERLLSLPMPIRCKAPASACHIVSDSKVTLTGYMEALPKSNRVRFEAENCKLGEKIIKSHVFAYFDTLRNKIITKLQSILKPEHASFISAIIFGETSFLENNELYRKTGITHLMAVSGQHLMILALFLTAILYKTGVPPLSRIIFVSVCLLFYALLTAGSPSVWRALLMYVFVALTAYLDAEHVPTRAISIAALLILLYNPANLYSPAFVLSFIAVLSIIFLRKPLEKLFSKLRLPQSVNRYLAASTAANIGTLPASACLFGSLPISGLIVNPLILWIFAYIFPMSFTIAILALISPEFALKFVPFLSLVLDGVTIFLEFFEKNLGLYFEFNKISPFIASLLYAILFAAAAYFNRKEAETAKETANSLETIRKKRSQRQRQNRIEQETQSEKEEPKAIKVPPKRKALENRNLLREIDNRLMQLPRLPVKGSELKIHPKLDPKLLQINAQNLYHRVMEADSKLYMESPDRLLESCTSLLGIVSMELLSRVSRLSSKPNFSPSDIKIKFRVEHRELAMAAITDSILAPAFIIEVPDEKFKIMLSELQGLFNKASDLLEGLLSPTDLSKLQKDYELLRSELFSWCSDFITLDLNQKHKKP